MPLNKYIAQCGIASRRKTAEMVKQGLVTVNDHIETNPAYRVQETDKVYLNNERISPEVRKVYILMNKPKDIITTVSDDRGRKTVMDLLKKIDVRVFPVGRLDRNTTGLLLLTNDGELAQHLSHPSKQIKKIYQVFLDRKFSPQDMALIRNGVKLEDGVAEVDAVDYVQDAELNQVGIEIHSGKNRIVRRIFEKLGYTVERLDRTYYAGLTKKDLPRGRHRHLREREVIMLKHFLR
jgi:23S rRNA pseudouridine2605 synthase